MSGVDDIVAIDFHLVNGTKAAEEEVTLSAAFQPEQALAAEDRFAKSLPGGIDVDGGGGRQPAAALHNHRASLQPAVNHVTEKPRADQQRLVWLRGGEMVEKQTLASEHPFEALEQAAAAATFLAGGGFHREVWRHGNHATDLTGQGFAFVKGETCDRCRGT